MKIVRYLAVFVLQVSTDGLIFNLIVLLDAQVEMTARVAYIIRITRIILKIHTRELLVCKLGLRLRSIQIFKDFPTCENSS